MKKYKYLIFDSCNFAYRLFKTQEETPEKLAKKYIYKNSVCYFIRAVEELKEKYLDLASGQIYFLFDNYFSKADLKSSFIYADRKQLDKAYKLNRKKESKEFYQSLDFLRYYYLIGPSIYHTVRIDHREADDLVKPLLENVCLNDDSLLVTTDLDWARYLSSTVDWLPKLSKEPEICEVLSQRLGFKVDENSLTLYKAIFGDTSDNITGLLPDNKKNKQEFLELLPLCPYPDYLIQLSRDPKLVEKYKILQALTEPEGRSYFALSGEKKFTINLQLISPMFCSKEQFKSHVTTGREVDNLYKAIRETIGLSEKSFKFGNIKRPRV